MIIDDNRYAPRPQPRHLKPRVARPEPVAAPRKPALEALYQRYVSGEIDFTELHALWPRTGDGWRLEVEQAETVATAVLLLGSSL